MTPGGSRDESRASNGSTTHWSTPQRESSVELVMRSVAMRAGASSACQRQRCEEVAWMRLEAQYNNSVTFR